MKTILNYVLLTLIFSHPMWSQKDILPEDKEQIETLFYKQEKDWNDGNINAFMEAYLKSDHIVFNGSNGPEYGWDSVKKRYLRSYPDIKMMGQVKFGLLKLFAVDDTMALLIGTFHLKREAGDLEGHFTLVWKKVNGRWYIISDHTSSKN